MPAPPANLASNCSALPPVPTPLIDPDRAVWESDLITAYSLCGVKHRLTVQAWNESLKGK